MTKRSPILGYNHNVRYRGLLFHVQTEDSGVLSPHLFTHLFHGGVIVSTRKLVYDAGSNEEAIKALMQAQHKAVMKDLRRGAFDDKIDQYLGGTAGLEPRSADSVGSLDSAPVAVPRPIASAAVDSTIPNPVDPASGSGPHVAPAQAKQPPELPPLPMDDEPATLQGDDALELVGSLSSPPQPPQPQARAATPPPIPAPKTSSSRASTPVPQDVPNESSPEIQIRFHDESSARVRVPDAGDLTSPNASPSSRPPSHGAAALPPVVRPPSRPSVTPPGALARQLTPAPVASAADARPQHAGDERSDVVDHRSPAAASAEPAPASRPGQYSVNRTTPTTQNVPLREKTGRIAPVPAGLTPPGRSAPIRAAPGANGPPSGPTPAIPTPPPRPQVTAPIATRPASGPNNVVMARPAVIVGAPPKPAPTHQRVRKAREDEGRGFGQGLISEKSLDEVILAYLSEDAENEK